MSDTQKKKDWTLLELLEWTTNYLLEKNFDDARLNTERLLAHTLGLSRVELYTNFDRPLTSDELLQFKKILKRRLAREPLQYIVGETEFYSLPVTVRPGVLIPRPETEILVEQVINYCTDRFENDEEFHVLDMGTGSGCIAIAIKKNCPNVQVTAVDISEDALGIARENAEINNVNISLKNIDALKPWPAEYTSSFNVVVSNPPYVSFREFEQLQPEIQEFEPKISLLGGNDGLDFYRRISNILTDLLKPNSAAFFEIGEKQSASVTNIFSEAGFENIQTIKDFAGKDRVIKMNWNRSS